MYVALPMRINGCVVDGSGLSINNTKCVHEGEHIATKIIFHEPSGIPAGMEAQGGGLKKLSVGGKFPGADDVLIRP